MLSRSLVLLGICLFQCLIEQAVVVGFSVGRRTFRTTTSRKSTSLWSKTTTETTTTDIDEVGSLKKMLVDLMSATDLGRSATEEQRHEIEENMHHLEGFCSMKEPNRSNLTNGAWNSLYSTAPPPSNGQLGPFRGEAQQVIDMEQGTYQNLLLVKPNNWLMATLDATFEEWDGVLLEEQEDMQQQRNNDASETMPQNDSIDDDDDDNEEQQPESLLLDTVSSWFSGAHKGTPLHTPIHIDVDHGATCWKVTFQRLTITLCGKYDVFVKDFSGNSTQRIWRTTYLDTDTRIVRAGKTGQRDDEMVFYMTRATN